MATLIRYRTFKILAVLCSLPFIEGRADAVLVVNGDFELPQLQEYKVLNAGDTALTGWRIERGVNDYLFLYLNTSGAGIAQSGNAFLGLAYGRISQQIAGLVPGAQYELEFWTSPFTSNYYYGPSTITVAMDDHALQLVYDGPYPGSDTRQPYGHEAHPWTQQLLRFTATADQMELSFTGGYFGPGGQFGNSTPGIDNVSIRQVPEPRTALLLLSGLGCRLRRRRF